MKQRAQVGLDFEMLLSNKEARKFLRIFPLRNHSCAVRSSSRTCIDNEIRLPTGGPGAVQGGTVAAQIAW